MNRHASVSVALLVVAVAAAVPVGATSTSQRPTFMTPFDPQGTFEVQALVNGFWQRVGELRYDRYVRERALALPVAALAAPQVHVRLVEHGGGAAHIDRVVLGDTPPSRVAGATEPDAVALAAHRDNDVLDAFGKTIELTFPGHTRGTALLLAARVEPKVNEGKPFAFPPANQSSLFTPASAFYHYTPATTGNKPTWPDGLDPSKALFAELCRPTTGHPDGVTYGWVTNDRDTLYAEVEFTPDNTCDGNKDFSSVTVERNGQLREFRVSEGQTRWGHPSFVSTDRAGYHHKLYTFAIPFSDLGIRTSKDAGDLKLAFAAYGTGATQWLSPWSHDFGAIGVGTTTPGFVVTIRNPFDTDITLDTTNYLTRSGGPNSTEFSVLPGATCTLGMTLHPGNACTFQIAFAPTVVGFAGDTFTSHVWDAQGVELTPLESITVQGNGAIPIPTFSPAGIALLVLALCGFGYFILRRR